MDQQLKPGPIISLVGGALLIICTFLDWVTGASGLDTDYSGLLGIFTLLIGIVVGVNAALDLFAPQMNRPDGLLGLSRNQISVALGFSAFIWTFGLQFSEFSEFGVTLGWIAAAGVVAGGIVADMQSAPTSSGPSQPTQF